MSPGNEQRPGVGTEALQSSLAAGSSVHGLSPEAAAQVAGNIDGAFVVLVVLPNEKVRRRVFLTLQSAQRHVDRARELGHVARAVLARLEAVSEVVA